MKTIDNYDYSFSYEEQTEYYENLFENQKGEPMENILKLNKNGSTLGLRELAKQINIQIKDCIDKNENIILDFEKVDSISSSFADELVAKLMFEIGKEKYLKLVKIRNANDFIKVMIYSSIVDREKERNQLL